MKTATDQSKAQIIGIRMSPATLATLDSIVKDCGYKSRSDCVKSLILERDAMLHAQTNNKEVLLQLIREDDDVRSAIAEIVGQAGTVKINNIKM